MKREFGLQHAFYDRALEFFANCFEQVPAIDSFELTQLRQPRRKRERITRKRSGLIDRTLRGKFVHDFGAAPKRADRQAAADHFTEGSQIGTHTGETLHATGADTKASHDLVEN